MKQEIKSVLTAILLIFLAYGTASAQAWDFESGAGDFEITNGTVESTFDFSRSGIRSLKITGSNTEVNTYLENSVYTDINPRDTLRFHVFANSFINLSEFHLYVKNGDELELLNHFISPDSLLLSQWNTLEMVIPNNASDVRAFGLMTYNSMEGEPVFYVDDVEVAAFDPDSYEPEPILETFDFEDDSGNWEIANNTGVLEVSDDTSYSGFQSIRVIAKPDTDLVEIANYSPSNYADEQLLRFMVWVPADVSDINSISPFIQTENFSVYTNNLYNIGDLETESWNEVSVEVPLYVQLDAIGLQILGNENATNLPSFYVDMITSNPGFEGNPTLTPPSAITEDSTSTTFASFSWSAATGNGTPRYYIYRNDTRIDTTQNLYYVDTNLASKTTYNYRVTTVDPFWRETQNGASISLTTEEFGAYQTWDFEESLENWSIKNGTGTATLTDTMAYSGFMGVELTANPDTNLIDFAIDGIIP
ncbi:MAG: hypothetical protein WD022_00635, partial [Balneolaceae bacterium]